MGTLFRFGVLIGCAALASCMTAYYGDRQKSGAQECVGPNTCEVKVTVSWVGKRLRVDLPDPIYVDVATYPSATPRISWVLQILMPGGEPISFPAKDGIKFENDDFKCGPEAHSLRAGSGARAQYLAFWCDDKAGKGEHRYGARLLIGDHEISIDPFVVNK